MPMRPTLILLVGLAALAPRAQAAPPVPDFTDLPGYIAALNKSQDPQAVAIRQEIADGPAALSRQRLEAGRDGLPLDPSRRPSLPPAVQNAAPLWARWKALRRQKPMRLAVYATPLRYGYAYTPLQLAAVQREFAAHRDALTLLHEATDRPRYVVSQSPAQALTGGFQDFAGFREGARELNTESYLLAQGGHFADAVTTQARGFRIVDQVTSQPSLIRSLVGDAVDAITLSGLNGILYLAGPNAAVDGQVRRAVAARRPAMPLRAALLGDVPISLAEFDLIRADPSNGLADALSKGTGRLARLKPLTGADKEFAGDLVDAAEAHYLRQMRQLAAAADLPPVARRTAFQWVAEERQSAADGDPVQALGNLIASVVATSDQSDDRRLAQEQVTMAAAAVLAVKARSGTFPGVLPGDFPDPFSGRPLRYRCEGKTGFVVYSVGTDGTFRGGRPGDTPFVPAQAFFRYPGPALRPVPPDMLK